MGHVPPGTDINDIHLSLCCIAVVLNQPLCKLLVTKQHWVDSSGQVWDRIALLYYHHYIEITLKVVVEEFANRTHGE